MSQNRIPPTFSPSSGQLVPLGRLAPLDGVSFDEFLDLSKIDASVTAHVVKTTNEYLASIPNVVPLAADTLLKVKQGGLRIIFSPEVQKALDEGVARLARRGKVNIGKALNTATGRYMETGEVVKASVSYASLSTAAALTVIQAAHMISAADLAKTLDEVSNKLDLMFEYREIDQNSRLEAIYYEVRRLTGIQARALDKAQTLADVRKIQFELVQLRAIWRN